MELSIVLCCYNSEKRLELTLNALANQDTVFPIEIILVDNNSSDNTVDFALSYWEKINANHPLKVTEEKQPGLSAARKKGVQNAQGKYVIFCDDDNHLAPDYVEMAVKIMEEDKTIGALCGFNEALVSIQLPETVKNNLTAYACGHEGMSSQYLNGSIVPWGAGLVMRTDFLKKIYAIDFKSLLDDRTGSKLSSGGDTEYCYLVKLAGFSWKYDTCLRLKHELPNDRLNLDYLKKLYEGFGKANVIIDWYYKRGQKEQLDNIIPWWKVFITQHLLFIKRKKEHDFEQELLKQAFVSGYKTQLFKERKKFRSKQLYVKKTLQIFDNESFTY